jgi:monoamine oxidase
MNIPSTKNRTLRSPLLRLMKDVFRKKYNIEDDSYEVEQYSNNTLKRRDVLKSGLLAGAGLIMPLSDGFANQQQPTKQIPTSDKTQTEIQPRIVIVGAGIAGLHAGWILQKKGLKASIYEASNRTGGRIMTGRNILGKDIITELGGEFIDSIHADMLGLAREFNLPIIDLENKAEQEFADVYSFGGVQKTEEQVKDILKQIQPLLESHAEKAKSSREMLINYDKMSAEELITSLGVDSWTKDFFRSAYITEYGVELDSLSSLPIIDILGHNQSADSKVELFGESDERYKIRGGNDRIIQELTKRLQSQIERGQSLESIRELSDGTFVLSFRKGSSSIQITADYVICAIPFSILRNIELKVELPPLQLKAIKELQYGTNSKIMMGFTNSLWREKFFSGTYYTDEIAQLVWDSSRLQDNENAVALTALLGGKRGASANQGTVNEQALSIINHLETILPTLSKQWNKRAHRFVWSEFQYSKGSYSSYSLGQTTDFGGWESRPKGRLFFAGEHCSNEFQGYMNGAAQTGRISAQAILTQLGK